MWAQLIEGSSNPFPIRADIVPRPLPLSNRFDSLFRASYIVYLTSDIVGEAAYIDLFDTRLGVPPWKQQLQSPLREDLP